MERTQNKMDNSRVCQFKNLIIARITILLHLLKTLGGDPYALHINILAYLLSPANILSNAFGKLLTNISVARLDSSMHPRKNISKQYSKCHKGSEEQSANCLLPGLPEEVALECLTLASRSNYPALACVSRRFRSLISSGYLYKLRQKLGIQEHWIFVSTADMPWEGFDPMIRRWMPMPPIPCDDCFKMADKESLAVGTQLLVFGRETSELAIWMYSLVTKEWSRARPMLHGRCLFGSASLNGVAILAGGVDPKGRVLNLAEMYNSETGTWKPLPGLNVARRSSAGFFMDGKFYVIGGLTQDGQSLTCGEEFDLETSVWRRIMNIYPVGVQVNPCQSPPLMAMVNHQLYAADKDLNVVKKYNKEDNTWNVVKNLPVQASPTGWGMAFRGCGDRLIVITGQRLVYSEGIVIHGWRPEGDPHETWEILSARERAGMFVQNCAIMGC
ncbi:Galactose oxidase/kelch repeat superfamily protein [Rhynchospora pubera]|uniref:Galactose oxidase/kelch repeat superfamily protein n=1 Tax=Rhynchospora pubera TaxID=906938 RepID=A0AAV8CG70_9POAL|nr:Galactose oxidase/kelch repeat superfamily protein [Rhynchospora pubera]